MADETVGQKMSAYTALAAGEKTYFMGDGNGSVSLFQLLALRKHTCFSGCCCGKRTGIRYAHW